MVSVPGEESSDAIEVFFSYSHKDEGLRKRLEEHLSVLRRQGVISGWHDRMIGAGQEWKGEIDRRLESAQIILLLISPSFLASDYCYDIEMKRAVERHERGEATVIPIILRPCDWQGAPFGKLQGLPKDVKPVTSWKQRDEAFKDVTEGIRRAISGDSGGTLPAVKPQDTIPKEGKRPAKATVAGSGVDADIDPPRASRKKNSQDAGPIIRASSGRGQATDSSGMYVLIDDRFFEAESVDEKDGLITMVASSEDAAVEAAIKGLRPPLHGSPKPIGYAHGNDAMLVRVKSIDSRSESGKKRWFITLVPEKMEYGGSHMEVTIGTSRGSVTPEDAARLRAGRILLNDPPYAPDQRKAGGDLLRTVEDAMVENAVQGSGAYLAKTCGVQLICSKQDIPLPQRFQIARLVAIFQLIVGDAVEHVRLLVIGPIKGKKVHVKFRGMRRRRFANVEPVEIEVEGDCPIS